MIGGLLDLSIQTPIGAAWVVHAKAARPAHGAELSLRSHR